MLPFRRKVEEQLQQSNTRGVWRGPNTITGRSTVSGGGPESGDQVLANRLNQLFNRFDSVALPSPIHQSSSHLSAAPHSTGDMKCTSPVPLFPSPSTTLLGLSRLHLLRRLRSFGGEQDTPKDILWHCGGVGYFLCCGLLAWWNGREGQGETQQAGQEGQLCPGLSAEVHRAGWGGEDVV